MAVNFKWSFELYMLKVENRAMNRVHSNIYNFNHNEKGSKKTKIYTQHRKYFKKMLRQKGNCIEITNLWVRIAKGMKTAIEKVIN